MDVTMISSLPPHKGISAYTVPLAAALSESPGLRLQLVSFRSLYPRFLFPGGEIDDRGMNVNLPSSVSVRRLMDWYNPASWVQAGLSIGGAIVHAQWWSYPLAPQYFTALRIARWRGKKVVLTIHNVMPHEKSRLNNFLNSLIYPMADHVIVHSEGMRETLHENGAFRRGQVSVVPHGLLKPPAPEVPDMAAARRELGVPEGASTVLYFGNIRPYKGLETLLEALSLVSQRVPRAHMLIAGEPWTDWEPYREMIERLGLSESVTERLGFVPYNKVHLYFTAADVVALPYTHFDAQSGVASIALAFHRPAVVTDVGGLPDMVADARAVVPPGDSGALAEALTAVLTDGALRAKLQADAELVARRFGWEEIAARTIEVYRQILAGES